MRTDNAPTSLRPFVPSGKDYQASLRLFQDLGYEKLFETPDLAGFKHGAAQFFLQKFDMPAFAEQYMVSITVPNLDAWWEDVQKLKLPEKYPGFRINPPKDFPWGREIHFIDLAGVCWHVRQ